MVVSEAIGQKEVGRSGWWAAWDLYEACCRTGNADEEIAEAQLASQSYGCVVDGWNLLRGEADFRPRSDSFLVVPVPVAPSLSETLLNYYYY